MAKIKQTKPMFKTTDGMEFAKEKDAVNWQEFLDAKSEFDVAKTHLISSMAKTQKTADGYDFDFGETYYYVDITYSEARVGEVRFYLYHTGIEVDENAKNYRGEAKVRLYDISYKEDKSNSKCFTISEDLFVDIKNVKKKIIEYNEDYVKMINLRYEKLKKEVEKDK